MSKQIDLVAYLHIGYGVLILLAAVIVFVAIAGGGLLSGEAEAIAITSGVGAFVALILVILAAPSLVGGFGLLRRRAWARVLVIVMSVLALFSFPIGTALGAYSLYVLVQDEAKAEF